MNNNKSITGVISLQESWATHISDYILQRRQQTYAAYVYPEQTTPMHNNSIQARFSNTSVLSELQQENTLFSAFFIVLASQLEEGHTVLTLYQADNERPVTGQVNNQPSSLYDWQIKILELLTAPFVDFIETDTIDKNLTKDRLTTFNVLSAMFAKRERLWWGASIDAAQREMLKQRLDLVTDIYDIFNQTDLASLVVKIENHALFMRLTDEDGDDNKRELALEKSNSLSKNKLNHYNKPQSPLIFKAHNKNRSAKQNQTSAINRVTLWLHRTWLAEYNLAQKINQILSNAVIPLDISIPDHLNQQQVNAINAANNNAFSIITGGPGTGKTYTVAQLVMALQKAQDEQTQSNEEGSQSNYEKIHFSTDSAALALAAPTGKAAQRMQESLQAAVDAANVDIQLQEAKTIHRLLGIGRTGKPRYNAENPLGEDIIIVDEASMLGVELANYLVSAVKPGARLILLGDANQLAAVDAGAVLADLCRIPLLSFIHVQLTESRRFSKDSGIGKLAHQINLDNVDHCAIWTLIREDDALSFENILLAQPDRDNKKLDSTIKNSLSKKNKNYKFYKYYQNYVNKTKNLLDNPITTSVPVNVKHTISSIMAVFNEFRVLSAGHHGKWGDYFINDYLTQWHKNALKLPLRQDAWYHGRPVMVLQNNYELGLYNGDIGICLQTAGRQGRLEVFFENKSQGIAVNLLNEELVATAYAMTIHKSQGSEFDHVAITFDGSHSRLLSKELIYTAVTRAKKQVSIYSTKQAFEIAVQTPTQRHTGLSLQFQ